MGKKLAVVRCVNGHFYENEKYLECPYCKGILLEKGVHIDFHENDKNTQKQYITGWLVGIKGILKGKDYRIFNSINTIEINGCDIVILYEEEKNKFYLFSNSKEIVYRNSLPVYETVSLEEGDILEISEEQYEFVAFCKGEKRWEIES
ncbi:hypothetical protein BHF69_03665 [Anaerostipes sp. 992a]|nr:hypothetical protein BHF69_03665 [Anaerostipes sp. 992a]